MTSGGVNNNLRSIGGNITSSSPSSRASYTSTQAREFVFAGVLTLGPNGDTVGTATSPFTLAGPTSGSNIL